MPKPISVLFVCTGNICRSPTAEGLFRAHVERAGKAEQFLIASAGTGDWHIGHPPDRRAISTARTRGLDISGLRARQLCAEDYTKFDYIIALDNGHYAHMKKQKPHDATASLSLLMSHAENAIIEDVPDPYFGGQAEFDQAYDMMEAGVSGLLKTLSQADGSR